MSRSEAVKRTMDLVGAALALVLLAPALAAIALAVLLSDGKPVLFRQLRAGRHGRPFTIYKFRTMRYREGAAPEPQYNWTGGVPDDFVFKSSSGPNVTCVGRFLRKYSLDELPQLWNVLLGHMSLVGPRPEILPITAHYDSNQSRRLLVRPGITGYAQINGRSDIPHGKKVALDVFYVYNRSIWMDVLIVIKTFSRAFTGAGSH